MASSDELRDRRRGEIVAVARKLVAEGGLSALTIGAIESRVDFTRGVITYHFKNKDDIVMAVFESAIDEIDAATTAAIGASGTFEEQLKTAVGGMVRGFLDHAEARAILIAFWSRMASDPRAEDVNAALYRRYREGAKALLDAGVAMGVLPEGVDTRTFGTLMVANVLGIVLLHAFSPDEVDVDGAVATATRTMLAGLRAR